MCAEAGACEFADCFTTEGQARAAAWQMIGRLKRRTENEAIKRQLERAVQFLRSS